MLKEPLLNINHLIPQKEPFVMVDTLICFSEDSITSSFKVSKSDIFTKDGYFLEPGIIENMAQTVALHTGYDYFLRSQKAPVGYIGSIKKVEIISLPKINDVITTKVKVLQEFMGVTLVDIEVFNDLDELIAKGQMKTVLAS